mmetsp:Transcript_22347/g.31576  ORF Transcript_22347/g.31576 Transcript_22347/m.31576 type:complete len:208 (-) Transcript_22347:65-688(-)|eukprot:CAMPEP_0175101782 /NCGR_PEP_ID=MMETSP0086_2-20121207/8025_1 /TAXON_ID=136419 /ORGANISM="Unknown Unknown, Strain D1" /LENGTH=207 /DNA_ID=CAMNT_0016376425 /DNA_START=77 /DNA_END=700 /DNA_ORIENTATION=-
MSKPLVVRLLTLGDTGAGKSSLLLRYTQGEFASDYMPTIGIDFRLKTIELNGKTVKVQVWDTAGQERFRTITHNYYKGAHGIALVYDCTVESTFYNIKKWIQDVHTYAENNVSLVLIGNKYDLKDERVIPEEQGRAVAEEFGIPFWETSAKADVNVNEAFSSLVTQVCERLAENSSSKNEASQPLRSTVNLSNPQKQDDSKSNKCCS